MSRWIQHEDHWYNLDDFDELWIEKKKSMDDQEVYYLAGEFKHKKENVILSEDFNYYDELVIMVSDLLGNNTFTNP